ncbi:MAG: SufE family protein [Bdellovibrionota bacterium]
MRLEELLDNFDLFEDWEDRYKYIIELGKKLPDLDDKHKREENKVQGCMSQVWMVALPSDPDSSSRTYHFLADSDAFIVKGLVAILLIIYNGKTKEDIAQTNIEDIFRKLNLEGHLSPTRRNGFFSMVQKIQSLAKD